MTLPARCRFSFRASAGLSRALLPALRSALLGVLLVFGAVTTGPAARAASDASAAWSIDQLMSTLAQKKAGSVRFIETKYIAILERPVESSGELVFRAPDHLEKRTVTPKPETMILDGDMMTVERAGKKYVVPLQNYPEMAGFIESIRATLGGNRHALERYYRLGIEGRASRWTLTLTPADSRMASTVRRIRITGANDRLDTIEIEQADGDRSVMAIRQEARQ